jgi:hypothetical protein
VDDIEYLNENDYFHETRNTRYIIENDEHAKLFNIDSRTNKRKLVITDKLDKVDIDTLIIEDFSIFTTNKEDKPDKENKEDKMDNGNMENSQAVQIVDLSDVCIYNYPVKKSSTVSSSSTFSSKSSNTSIDSGDENENENDDEQDNSDTNSNDDNHGHSDDDDESSCESDEDEEDVFCSIFNFPVQMIALEKCENTLDYLMENDLLEDHEWTSCLFQIIISLAVFQKTFSFTHNDLHTNNIMYIPTDREFLYYTFNNVTYKVPTYGKIYKIIDFGRAIYKFQGQTMCSDSFHLKGDAGSQYNCEPYLDENKPRLEPNPSFDLCRLACCLYDHFVEDIFDAEEILKKNKIAKLIGSWLMDDKDRNILYKNSGEERYPEFKLYKMIARTIHKAIPYVQLDNDIFKKYITSKKKLNKNAKIMNLDAIPNLQ